MAGGRERSWISGQRSREEPEPRLAAKRGAGADSWRLREEVGPAASGRARSWQSAIERGAHSRSQLPVAKRGAGASGRQLREELAAVREELEHVGCGRERNRWPREEPRPTADGRARSQQSAAKRSRRSMTERGAGSSSR